LVIPAGTWKSEERKKKGGTSGACRGGRDRLPIKISLMAGAEGSGLV